MTAPRPTDWSDGQVAELIRLHRAGLPVADIAAAIGKSPGACQSKVKHLRAAGMALASRNAPPAVCPKRIEADDDADTLRSARACAAHGRDIERTGRRWSMEASI